MSRTSGRSSRTGDSGSYLDGATGPLPLFGGLVAAAAVVALGGPAGWATAVGLATLGASALPGLNRATKARAQQEKQARVAEERRRAAKGGRRDRWERLRHTADESHDRFERAVERCQPGPLRDRLRDMAPEVERARARVGHLVDSGSTWRRRSSIGGAPTLPRVGRATRGPRARAGRRPPPTGRRRGSRPSATRWSGGPRTSTPRSPPPWRSPSS